MAKPTTPDLSIIVPAFHCRTINSDLKKLHSYLQKLNLKSEIICVVDGLSSKTDTTYKRASLVKRKNLKVIFYLQNKGKGYAVRTGFKEASGKIIGFFDAGSDIALSDIKTALALLKKENADIVIGSKRHPQSKINNYPTKRRFLSSFSQLFTKLAFNLSVSDTQVGLKFFKKSVIEKVLPRMSINGFAFDVELLALANKSGFKKIIESPVNVTYNKRSTIKPLSLLSFLKESLTIALNL